MGQRVVEGGRIVIGHGARAVEELVLDEVLALVEAARSRPEVLARPVVVVVPSRSLRRHLAARLVARAGHALAGVRVVTLHGLAQEILAGAGEEAPLGAPLLPVLVARAARRSGALRAALEPLAEGYAVLTGTVRDLLDAGFTEDHAEALDERLIELGEADGPVARARAIVQVAGEVAVAMREAGAGRSSTLLSRACDLVRASSGRALAARAVVIHGFAETTGVAGDLIEAVARTCGAAVVLDEPPDPLRPDHVDLGVAFSARLRERLEAVTGKAHEPGLPPSVAEAVEMFRAPGRFAEAREVAERVRRLLDGGARPEGIAIVARDLAAREIPLHQHLGRLAVPYSSEGAAGLAGPASRRATALAELLAAGPDAAVDAWFEVTGGGDAHPLDVRLATRVAGVASVGALAALDVAEVVGERGGVVLPVGRALEAAEGEGEGSRTRRRFVSREALERARDSAAGWLRAWHALPGRGPAPAQVAAAERLVVRVQEGGEAALAALAELAASVPSRVALERDETLALAAEALRSGGRTAAGGSGAGVQVLGVVEARGRTFEHLFVLGLNRDCFPRVIREDALLPDRVRQALAVVLPDLPLKRGGFDEERYLFAQLLSAAPHVTLSWLECDDDGRATPPSPLVERLLLGGGGQAKLVGDLYASGRVAGKGVPRPAHEHLVLAGLYGSRSDVVALLPVALDAAGVRDGERVARARAAVLDELDPDRRTAAGRARAAAPGPYLGFVGAVDPARPGPRREPIPVTTLQDLAACPWQTFLRRLLHIEPPPEAGAALAAVDRALVGSTVHRVLEVLVGSAEGGEAADLASALARPARRLVWPAAGEVAGITIAAAGDVLRDEGLHLPGLARVLAAAAGPFLDVARELDGGEAAAVVAAEVTGRALLGDGRGGTRTLAFRADRLELAGNGPRLVDFKTGAPPSAARTPGGKRAATVRNVARGLWLQAAVYTRAETGPAQGRYLFLSPDLDGEGRVWDIGPDDPEVAGALESVVASLLAAWETGAFFPRLVDRRGRKEPTRCGWCPVRQACQVGDSGVRRRLIGWAGANEGGRPGDAERAALTVWRIGAESEGEGA